MWYCPICSVENEGNHCKNCGYEITRDFLSNRTIGKVSSSDAKLLLMSRTIARLKQEREHEHQPVAQETPAVQAAQSQAAGSQNDPNQQTKLKLITDFSGTLTEQVRRLEKRQDQIAAQQEKQKAPSLNAQREEQKTASLNAHQVDPKTASLIRQQAWQVLLKQKCSQILDKQDKIYDVYSANNPKLCRKLGVTDPNVCLCHDDTLIHSGKNGFVITYQGIYVKELFSKTIFTPFSELAEKKNLEFKQSNLYADGTLVAYQTSREAQDKLKTFLQDLIISYREIQTQDVETLRNRFGTDTSAGAPQSVRTAPAAKTTAAVKNSRPASSAVLTKDDHFCINCGRRIKPNATFCLYCGTKQ